MLIYYFQSHAYMQLNTALWNLIHIMAACGGTIIPISLRYFSIFTYDMTYCKSVILKGHCHSSFAFLGHNWLQIETWYLHSQVTTFLTNQKGNFKLILTRKPPIRNFWRFLEYTVSKLEKIGHWFFQVSIRSLAILRCRWEKMVLVH